MGGPIRRLAKRGLAYFSLGLLITISIAWAQAAALSAGTFPSMMDPPMWGNFGARVILHTSATYGVRRYAMQGVPETLRDDVTGRVPAWAVPADPVHLYTALGHGWPLVCLVSEYRGDPFNVTRIDQARGIVLKRASAKPIVLPIRPWWPGLIGNGAVWMTVIAVTVGYFERGRRLRRISAGRCGRCAYDLRSLPAASPCPECGETDSGR